MCYLMVIMLYLITFKCKWHGVLFGGGQFSGGGGGGDVCVCVGGVAFSRLTTSPKLAPARKPNFNLSQIGASISRIQVTRRLVWYGLLIHITQGTR